ncbi:MAG: sulfur carrier protein ThiS [Methylobacteriaceae bacterium]|jgi:sulfur carrier protein|nr:sulfur carrier protein ThiS [Methylobacteriaceae bacterium]
MKITVNGVATAFDAAPSVADVLSADNIALKGAVSVQVNGEFVDEGGYTETVLNDGDELDYLFFLGGGSRR